MPVQNLNLHGYSRDEVIQNFNIRVFRNFADLSILRRGFDHDFKTVSLSSWLPLSRTLLFTHI